MAEDRMMGPVHPVLATRLRAECTRYPSLVAQFALVYDALIHHTPAYLPLSAEEEARSQKLVSFAEAHFGGAWFHGGRAEIPPGETLRSARERADYPNDARPRPSISYQLVYVSPSRALAQSFANAARGAVYLVVPDQTLMIAPFVLRAFRLIELWHGERAVQSLFPHCLLEFACRSATVLKACEPTTPMFQIPARTGRAAHIVEAQKND